jgi:hypothetical protein
MPRPDDAPDALVTIAVDFDTKSDTWLVRYRGRDGEADRPVGLRGGSPTLGAALNRARDRAIALVSTPRRAERVVIFQGISEHLIVVPQDGKVRVRAGRDNHRHPDHRKRPRPPAAPKAPRQYQPCWACGGTRVMTRVCAALEPGRELVTTCCADCETRRSQHYRKRRPAPAPEGPT